MNLGLFYDTETTGLPLWKERSSHHGQPHLVQLAAHLVDLDTSNKINTIDLTIAPDGWVIPKEASDVHGITTGYASEIGVNECFAVAAFYNMWELADVRIAHNEPFDARIMRIAIARHINNVESDKWKEGRGECTMKMSSPIVKAPPTDKMIAAGRTHHKSASMSEAYNHFTGLDLENAHTAIADVNACVDVYFAINKISSII